MSSRKETPDVLGEILNSPTPAAKPEPDSAGIKRPPRLEPEPSSTSAQSSPAANRPKQRAAAKKSPTQWEYMEVIFRDFRGWRPRSVNGNELDDWKDQPEIADYLAELGREGWEMVGIVNSRRNMRDAYFKRIRRTVR